MILTEKQENKLTAKQLIIFNELQRGETIEQIAERFPFTNTNTILKAIASIEKKLNIKL